MQNRFWKFVIDFGCQKKSYFAKKIELVYGDGSD